MKSSKNSLIMRRLAICGFVSVTALSMGCSLLSLLSGGASATPTNTPASTFPTVGPKTPTPTITPTVSPTPTSQPTITSFLYPTRSGTTGSNTQIINGSNLQGLTGLTLLYPSVTLANSVAVTGFTVNPGGTQITFTVPNLGFGATTITAQLTNIVGTTLDSTITFQYTGP